MGIIYSIIFLYFSFILLFFPNLIYGLGGVLGEGAGNAIKSTKTLKNIGKKRAFII